MARTSLFLAAVAGFALIACTDSPTERTGVDRSASKGDDGSICQPACAANEECDDGQCKAQGGDDGAGGNDADDNGAGGDDGAGGNDADDNGAGGDGGDDDGGAGGASGAACVTDADCAPDEECEDGACQAHGGGN